MLDDEQNRLSTILATKLGARADSSFTVKSYLHHRNPNKLIDYKWVGLKLLTRLSDRYLRSASECSGGFSKLMILSGLIESLALILKRSLYTPHGGGGAYFQCVLDEVASTEKITGDEFYRNIRCALLHQLQTYGGWKVMAEPGLLTLKPDREWCVNYFGYRAIYPDRLRLRCGEYVNELCLKSIPAEPDLFLGARQYLDHCVIKCLPDEDVVPLFRKFASTRPALQQALGQFEVKQRHDRLLKAVFETEAHEEFFRVLIDTK